MNAKLTRLVASRFKDHGFIWFAVILAMAVLAAPLQLHIPLGRYQHYGLVVAVLGFGYFVQAAWSWKYLTVWPRLGYLVTGLYLASIGVVLYANPWLDTRMAVMTEEKENLRRSIGLIYTWLSVPLAVVYLGWMRSERITARQKGKKG